MVHSWNARSIISQSKSKISLLLTFALIIGRHCERVGELFFVACHTAFPSSHPNGSLLRSNLTVFDFFVTGSRCYFRLCHPHTHTHTYTHTEDSFAAHVFPMISKVVGSNQGKMAEGKKNPWPSSNELRASFSYVERCYQPF